MTRKEILEKTIDFDDAINRIVRLEEENAELKEINTHTLSQLNLYNGELIIQLTKAKELLKKVLDLKKVVTKAEEYLLLEEAEQFLKETK